VNGLTIVAPGPELFAEHLVIINDPTGAGANFVPFRLAERVFNVSARSLATNWGDVIRIGSGQAPSVRSIRPPKCLRHHGADRQDDSERSNKLPDSRISGNWTITRPSPVITNLNHLEGMQVTGWRWASDSAHHRRKRNRYARNGRFLDQDRSALVRSCRRFILRKLRRLDPRQRKV